VAQTGFSRNTRYSCTVLFNSQKYLKPKCPDHVVSVSAGSSSTFIIGIFACRVDSFRQSSVVYKPPGQASSPALSLLFARTYSCYLRQRREPKATALALTTSRQQLPFAQEYSFLAGHVSSLIVRTFHCVPVSHRGDQASPPLSSHNWSCTCAGTGASTKSHNTNAPGNPR
jgi:hypothetical protein